MKRKAFKGKKLQLKNSGELVLFFLGVGSAFTKRQNQTNLLIIKGNDHLLVDCGTKCPQALYEAGVFITEIKKILITHSHADHIGGLEEIALMGRYVAKSKPDIIITREYEDILWNTSLRGGIAFNEGTLKTPLAFKDLFNAIRPKKLRSYKRATYEADVGSLNIKMFRTKHIPDNSKNWKTSFWSCGIIIDDRILFTSDTRYDEELVIEYEKKFQFEVIFHDCQFFTGGVHPSLGELNQLPEKIKEKMFLTHYGDNWEQFAARIAKFGFAGLAQQRLFYIFN